MSKIAFVSDSYYPSIGGTQMLCKNISEFFKSKGHEIEIITTFDSNRDLHFFDYKVKQFKNLNFSKTDIFLNNNYDHVFFLCDLFSMSLNTVELSKIKNKTLILNLDENVYNWIKTKQAGFTDERTRFLIKQIKNFTNVVSFCKGAPVNNFLQENGIKFSFIPNFSRDCSVENTLIEKIKNVIPLDKKIIFNYGNIEHRKNQLNLMNSFLSSELKEDYRLVILGSPRTEQDQVYMNNILKTQKTNDKNKNVIFINGTNNTNIIDSMLQLSNVFVLPSLAEGLPLVLLEAMSAGLPWVSTPCGGVPGVMSHMESGVVLNDFSLNPSTLEEAVRKVENKNSREDWQDNFTKELCCQKYLELL